MSDENGKIERTDEQTPAQPAQDAPVERDDAANRELVLEVRDLGLNIDNLRLDIDEINQRHETEDENRHFRFSRLVEWLIGVVLVVVLIFLLLVAAQRLGDMIRDDPSVEWHVLPLFRSPSPNESAFMERANRVLNRAEEINDRNNDLLSFLEGMSVFIAVALGAAAFYGLRNARELRADMTKETEKLREEYTRIRELSHQVQMLQRDSERNLDDLAQKIEAFDGEYERLRTLRTQHESELEGVREQLQKSRRASDELVTKVEKQVDDLELTLADLLEAHEALRNKNYQQAYSAVRRVLQRDPSNIEALHISGWLKLNYLRVARIDGVPTLDSGIDDLELAHKLAQESDSPRPAIQATLGVLLRRKAVRSEGNMRTNLFKRAEKLLQEALEDNNGLLDLSHESFWGPVAGLRRDQNNRDGAIDAYTKAVEVTPGSTYPRGNLAALLLDRYRESRNEEDRQKAMTHFRRTFELAQARLAVSPGDYYLMMDTAMAHMIRARDPENDLPATKVFQEAHERLAEAFKLAQSPEMLLTSERGWSFLLAACPKDWEDVRANLQAALRKIDDEVARMKLEQSNAGGSADSDPPGDDSGSEPNPDPGPESGPEPVPGV